MQDLKKLKLLASNYSVLYVEDDKDIANVFKSYLQKIFKDVTHKENGKEGLEAYENKKYDIVITDILMPIMDGLEMAEKIKEINEEQNILIISAYSDTEKFTASIKIGVDGYIMKPIDYIDLNKLLFKIVIKLTKFKEHEQYEQSLKSIIIEKNNDNLKLSLEKIDNYEKTLIALIDIIESRDTYTGKHSLRVAQYSKLIAEKMDFSKEECDELYRASILHDIGKIAIPDSLLLKPTKLNENEYNLIKEHVNIGYHMLKQIPMFENIANIINCHHERLDGSGYPKGLKGDDIPIKSNIMALADCFDAMTTNRIYKGRKEALEALEELKSLIGTHFRKDIVDAAIVALKDIRIDNDITQLPQTTLEEQRFSYFYKDSLTELFNERYLDFILSKNSFDKEYKTANLLFITNFSKYNNEHGWSKGNELLAIIAQELMVLFDNSLLFRLHGDDFVVLNKKTKEENQQLSKKLELFIKNCYKKIGLTYKEFDIEKNKVVSLINLEKNL